MEGEIFESEEETDVWRGEDADVRVRVRVLGLMRDGLEEVVVGEEEETEKGGVGLGEGGGEGDGGKGDGDGSVWSETELFK